MQFTNNNRVEPLYFHEAQQGEALLNNLGTESRKSFVGPKIWDIIPGNIKKASSFTIFKNKIKSWVPEGCPCKLCKYYVQGLGYVPIT